MNRRSLAALLASAAVFAAAPVVAVAQSAVNDAGKNPGKLRVALLPDENASTLIQNAQPLKDHLARTLGKEIEIIVTTDYSSMIEAMRFGRIEVAYFGPFSYVLAKSRAPGIEPFAVGVERGSPSYKSILIAARNGPVKTVADVKGQAFAFGDQASTSSHLAPRAYLLKEAGLEASRDYKAIHLGAHDAVARAVQAGQAPAGALSKPIFETLVARKTIDPDRLLVLAETASIPNYPMVMQGDLAPSLKAAIRKAFLETKDKDVLKAFRVEAFVAADDATYDVLRDMAKILQLDVASMK